MITLLLFKLGFCRFLNSHRRNGISMRQTGRWWALLFAVNFFCDVVVSDRIIPVRTGVTFGPSFREPKFHIEFHSIDSPFQPDDGQESVVMPNKDGEKFLCFLPKVEKSKSRKLVAEQNVSGMIVESHKHFKLKTPDELLDVLKDRCFIRQEGWWSYEFCYHSKVRQLHFEDEKVVQEFVLGVYDAEATETNNQNLSDISTLKDPRANDASQRYHSHLFTNGTPCDLTNQPRETEVRFVCSEPRAMISSITELSTCKYALTFHCPTLCKHPLFQERPISHTIHCNVLTKGEKEAETKEENSQDGKITMHAIDAEYQESYYGKSAGSVKEPA